MSNSTEHTEKQKSYTPNYAEKTHKSNYLATDEQLEGTPFVIRWREGKGWFLTIGDTRITDPTNTKEETLDLMKKDLWKIIAAMIVHIVNLLHKNPDMEVTKNDNMTTK